MTEEEQVMSIKNDNSNKELNSTNLTISLPSELSFLNKVPSTVLNKNVMTNNRKIIADKPPPIPTTTNIVNNNLCLKDEAIFGSCWRNNQQHTHHLMNSSYVVSSPLSLPSSVLSCDASQTSPSPINNKIHLNQYKNKNNDDNRFPYFPKQNYFESLHSYKHYNNEISNNRQSLNKPGQRNINNKLLVKFLAKTPKN